jgi:hypothetical protein
MHAVQETKSLICFDIGDMNVTSSNSRMGEMPPLVRTNSQNRFLFCFRVSEAMYAKVDRNERVKASESFFARDY